VGVLRLDLFIPQSQSLKAKRQVIKGLRVRVRRRFNVSVCELDNLDLWQRATLGIAFLSNESSYVHLILSQVERSLEEDGRIQILHSSIELR